MRPATHVLLGSAEAGGFRRGVSPATHVLLGLLYELLCYMVPHVLILKTTVPLMTYCSILPVPNCHVGLLLLGLTTSIGILVLGSEL